MTISIAQERRELAKKTRAEYYQNNKEKTKADVKRWAKKNPEKVRCYKDKWIANNPEENRICKLNYYHKNKDKLEYKIKIVARRKTRVLTRQACEVCGDTKSEGHHEDYSKPLEVIWLCREHHLLRHAELKEVQNDN